MNAVPIWVSSPMATGPGLRTVDRTSFPTSPLSNGGIHAQVSRAAVVSRRLRIPTDERGRKTVETITAGNTDRQVAWVHSYVSDDDRTTWCIYDSAHPRGHPRRSRRERPARRTDQPGHRPRSLLLTAPTAECPTHINERLPVGPAETGGRHERNQEGHGGRHTRRRVRARHGNADGRQRCRTATRSRRRARSRTSRSMLRRCSAAVACPVSAWRHC